MVQIRRGAVRIMLCTRRLTQMCTRCTVQSMMLRDYLDLHRLTASSFAEMVGVKHSSVSRWAAGETRPDWGRIARIQEVTNGAVTAADFVPFTPAETATLPAGDAA